MRMKRIPWIFTGDGMNECGHPCQKTQAARDFFPLNSPVPSEGAGMGNFPSPRKSTKRRLQWPYMPLGLEAWACLQVLAPGAGITSLDQFVVSTHATGARAIMPGAGNHDGAVARSSFLQCGMKLTESKGLAIAGQEEALLEPPMMPAGQAPG